MNAVMKSLLSHRSIRSYQDRPVSEEDLTQIIQAVQAAPNWVNVQLVSVIAIKDAERRSHLSVLCGNQKHIAEAPVFLVFGADYYRTWLACRAKGQSLDTVLEDMDTVLVGAHETGIAVGTAVAAAESLGLGTVVIGDIRQNPLEVIAELGLPPYVFPVLGLCIGYAAARFVVEFFREPDAYLGLGLLGLSRGQWLTLPVLALGLGLFWISRKKDVS